MMNRMEALQASLDSALGSSDFQESVACSLRTIALELLYIIENQEAIQKKLDRRTK